MVALLGKPPSLIMWFCVWVIAIPIDVGRGYFWANLLATGSTGLVQSVTGKWVQSVTVGESAR